MHLSTLLLELNYTTFFIKLVIVSIPSIIFVWTNFPGFLNKIECSLTVQSSEFIL